MKFTNLDSLLAYSYSDILPSIYLVVSRDMRISMLELEDIDNTLRDDANELINYFTTLCLNDKMSDLIKSELSGYVSMLSDSYEPSLKKLKEISEDEETSEVVLESLAYAYDAIVSYNMLEIKKETSGGRDPKGSLISKEMLGMFVGIDAKTSTLYSEFTSQIAIYLNSFSKYPDLSDDILDSLVFVSLAIVYTLATRLKLLDMGNITSMRSIIEAF